MSLQSIKSHLPSEVQSIIGSRATWDGNMKNISSSKLLVAIEAIEHRARLSKGTKVFSFAARAISELSVRNLDSSQSDKLRKLKRKLSHAVKSCFVDFEMTPEITGVAARAVGAGAQHGERLHVYGSVIKDQYNRWCVSRSSKDFSEYLASHASTAEKREMRNNVVRYFTSQEAERYLTTFRHGRIVQKGHQLGSGNYMFTLNMHGDRLYVGKKEKGKLHHASFTAGDPVQCAGRLIIKNGEIKKVKLDSGHYKPKAEHGENLRAYLSHSSRLGSSTEHLPIISHRN